MERRKRKKKKIWVSAAVCAVCIVCIMAAVRGSKKEGSGYGAPMLGDEFIVRYQYENIDEEGVLFPYYSPVEVEMQVGLWYKEGYTPGKENPYIEISWEKEKGLRKEKVKKFYLDDPYYREGVYDKKQGDPELEPISIRLFMNKYMIPEEGTIVVRFIVDTKPYEIIFDKQSPPDIMYLKYKKQEDGLLVYTEKKQDKQEDGWILEQWQEDELFKWYSFEAYEIFRRAI